MNFCLDFEVSRKRPDFRVSFVRIFSNSITEVKKIGIRNLISRLGHTRSMNRIIEILSDERLERRTMKITGKNPQMDMDILCTSGDLNDIRPREKEKVVPHYVNKASRVAGA